MRIHLSHWRIASALVLALTLAACGATGPQSQAPAATAAPAPTQPAMANTAIPAATATSRPATNPPAATAVPEPPSPEPIALLPASKAWIRSGDTIFALGDKQRQLALRAPGFPAYRYSTAVAPDGSHIAYVNEHDQLTIIDTSVGVLALPESAGQTPMGYSFSPDGRALAATFNDGQHWRLQVIDLQSRATRTLQEGALFAQSSDSLPLALMPIAWTPAGILAQRILWASDAPPQGLVLVSPTDGSTQELRQEAHIQAAAAPDGGRIAIVTGETPMEPDAQPTMEIRVLDASGGNEQVIVPKKPGFVRDLRWSPDGAMLLYSASEKYDSQAASVALIRADGTNGQRIDFSIGGPNEMGLQDLAWADSKTALILLANAAARIEVNALPVSSFDTNSLRLLDTLSGQPDVDHRIVYVPRGV